MKCAVPLKNLVIDCGVVGLLCVSSVWYVFADESSACIFTVKWLGWGCVQVLSTQGRRHVTTEKWGRRDKIVTLSLWPGGAGSVILWNMGTHLQADAGLWPRRPKSQLSLLWQPESWNIVLKQLSGYLKTFWYRQHVDDLTVIHFWILCSLYFSVSQELQIVITFVQWFRCNWQIFVDLFLTFWEIYFFKATDLYAIF
jgi:hypothetical protein